MTFAELPEDPLNRFRFPVDEWRLVETRPSTSDLGVTESLFAVGNGYLGMRGNPEEGRDAHTHGTYINGFHETWPISHAEAAYGLATTGQTIVNAPDTKIMKIYVDDEPLIISIADLVEYERILDFRDGILYRDLVWRTPSGKRVRVRTTRMVSFTDRHLAVMTVELTMLRGSAPVVISSQILNRQDLSDEYRTSEAVPGVGFDPRQASAFEHRVLEPALQWRTPRRMTLGYRCANSRMTIAVGADHELVTDNPYEVRYSLEQDLAKQVFRITAQEGVPVRLTKTVAYHTSRSVPVAELSDRVRRTLDRVRVDGVEKVHAAQRAWLDEYWERSDVRIERQPHLQQATRWCLFHLAQAAARADQHGIAAKGVTGSGYEGHYFWDTEIYVVPFLAYTNPVMARNALRFRVSLLDAARRRAAEMSLRGALYPWRTINGEEASAYYAAGTAQYHIDGDIAFALCTYAEVTGDREFMLNDGVLVLIETARMWADLGFWRNNGEPEFHIHGVTGPDEYTTVVNNNLFTNLMARANLRSAAAVVRELRERNPRRYAEICADLELDEQELEDWERCADGMVIPFDETLGIHPQAEHFLDRELWDLDNTPADKRPLLLHYHPLVIYRFQVLKQADVVLALFLHGDEFTPEEKRADFEYYDPITTGDSSLSAVVQSIMAAEVGYPGLALHYFREGLFVDLIDLHGNAADGVHIASAGGVWNVLTHGFGGLRNRSGVITFDPRLPVQWEALEFPLQVRSTRFVVRVEQESISFAHVEGPEVEVVVRGTAVTVAPGDPVVVPLDGHGRRDTWRPSVASLVGDQRADGSRLRAEVPPHAGAWHAPFGD